MVGGQESTSFFCMSISSCPNTIVEKTILLPTNFLGILVENQLTIHVWTYFWILSSILLVCAPLLMQVLHYLDNYSFAVTSEIERC